MLIWVVALIGTVAICHASPQDDPRDDSSRRISTEAGERARIANEKIVTVPGGRRLEATGAARALDGRNLLRRIVNPEVLGPQMSMVPETLAAQAFFEANVGQFDDAARFATRGAMYSLFATRQGFVSVSGRVALKDEQYKPKYESLVLGVSLEGGAEIEPKGVGKLAARARYYVGENQSHLQQQASLFTGVRYDDVYPGIDMYLTGENGQVAFGFTLESQGKVSDILLRIDGAGSVKIDGRGNLILYSRAGNMAYSAPRIIEQVGNTTRRLKGEFVILHDNVVGFKVSGRTPGAKMVIDPVAVFSTYFGGEGQEGMLGQDNGALDSIGRGFDIAVNATGHVFVTGMTFSPDFPTTTGPVMNGSSDAFAMRLDPTQPEDPLVYVTFIGGSSEDRGRAIAASPEGDAFVTGFTFSTDFPAGPEPSIFGTSHSGGFIARIDGDGTLNSATTVSPESGYHPNSIEFEVREDGSRRVYIGGWVRQNEAAGSGALATPGAMQETATGTDGFIAVIDPELSAYEYFTYLGGSSKDIIMDIAALDGYAYATGVTTSFDFPATEFAAQPAHSSADTQDVDCPTEFAATCFDSFAVRLREDGSDLVYGTYLGAAGSEDFARGIAVGSNNRAVITGGARTAAAPDVSEIFVTRLESLGGGLDYEVRLAGEDSDHGEEIVVDGLGRAHFTGTVSIDGFAEGSATDINGVPVATAQQFQGGDSDFFYGRITDDGDLDFFTYLGGEATDRGFAVATIGQTEEKFCAHVVGSTTSSDLTIINAIQNEPASAQADMALITLCDFPLPPVVSKQGPETVEPGDPFNYTIVVLNPGDLPVDLEISDVLPNSITVVGVVGCGLPIGNSFSCDLTVDGGGTAAIVVQAIAPTTCDEEFTNEVKMEYEFEGSQLSQTDSVTTRVDCDPDDDPPDDPPDDLPPPDPYCGDGVVNVFGEQCDGGANCDSECRFIVCGNGIVQPGEDCEPDGSDDEACNSSCITTIPPLGDCSSDGDPCSDGTVCARVCSMVEPICHGFRVHGVCIGIEEDIGLLCRTDARCVSAGSVDGNDIVISQN